MFSSDFKYNIFDNGKMYQSTLHWRSGEDGSPLHLIEAHVKGCMLSGPGENCKLRRMLIINVFDLGQLKCNAVPYNMYLLKGS